ncbi:hypothetical protein [Actinomadura sp. WMMA1423]|uniref:hypothetical protein n=1 Tax=Actinomadura sp. WMMA1423 TaxID=2591108 RepID=UPI001146C8CA|nr:hypothetical protein [Actinomadura sp. WMMA1423]
MPDGRRFDQQVAEDEREERLRRESLRSLEEGGLGTVAGRDWIGRVSYEASGNGALHNAQRDLYVFEGAKEERPVRIWYMPKKAAERLVPDNLASIPSLPGLQRALEHSSVVHVRGTEGTGRMTAALAALLQWCRPAPAAGAGEEPPVGVLQVEGSLALVRATDLRPRHGYVIEVGEVDRGRRLDAELPGLESLALKRDCRLVLLVPAQGPAPFGTVIEHRPPGAVEVFRRWLDREALAYGIERRTLAGPALRAVEGLLAEETSPCKAVDHACRLVRGLAEGRAAEEVIAEFPDRVREEVRLRLSERRPILGRCFMASVAVLHGMKETTVSQAALDLAQQIDAAWKREDGRRPLPTWEDLQTWLDLAGAVARPMPTGGGRLVALRQRTRAGTTLQVLWEEQPTIREPLMAWLDRLAHRPETAIRAAHAVGLLATFDFDTVDERFIRPWSKSAARQDQRLAAWVLEAAAREPALESRVREHLLRLSRGTRGEVLVAIRAHGSHLGAGDLTDALKVFGTASRRFSRDTADAVAASLSFLYSAKTATEITGALADWAVSEHSGSRLTAATVFLRIAAPRSRPGRPDLIEIARRGEAAGRIARLWQHALLLRAVEPSGRERPAAPEAWGLFARWMVAYGEAPELRSVIEQVVSGGGAEAGGLRAAFRLHARLLLHRGAITRTAYHRLLRLVPAQHQTRS